MRTWLLSARGTDIEAAHILIEQGTVSVRERPTGHNVRDSGATKSFPQLPAVGGNHCQIINNPTQQVMYQTIKFKPFC